MHLRENVEILENQQLLERGENATSLRKLKQTLKIDSNNKTQTNVERYVKQTVIMSIIFVSFLQWLYYVLNKSKNIVLRQYEETFLCITQLLKTVQSEL